VLFVACEGERVSWRQRGWRAGPPTSPTY